jgi:hypothetical protein
MRLASATVRVSAADDSIARSSSVAAIFQRRAEFGSPYVLSVSARALQRAGRSPDRVFDILPKYPGTLLTFGAFVTVSIDVL